MRIGVLTRARDPLSIASYLGHVVRELSRRGTRFTELDETGPAPAGLDLIWDPGLGMRRVPDLLRRATEPIVATVHGLLGFALPAAETAPSLAARARQALLVHRVRRDWERLRTRVRRVITVSPYGAAEAQRALELPSERLTAILHGVDHEVFRPDGPRSERARPFLLMVAQHQPKKNVDRVFEAFAGLQRAGRPDLLAVVPGLPTRGSLPDGVEVLRRPQTPAELAVLYRTALALVAPSLHETFGMPLAEAMACGCPVITSTTTACPQVTGNAALLVDPRSVRAIRDGMREVIRNEVMRERLAARGLARARELTWQASADRHAAVFEAALRGDGS
jgi:glycosyltransferase involved in cell wall biosynthesis